MTIARVVAGALAGLLCGCSGMGGGDTETRPTSDRLVYVRLAASRMNAGEIGSAILAPQGDRTQVSIEVSGVPLGTTLPIHLYTFIYAGACARLPPTPAYALTDLVLADSPSAPGRTAAAAPPFRVVNIAPANLATLRASPHAIQVRTAPADGDRPIFCGDIEGKQS